MRRAKAAERSMSLMNTVRYGVFSAREILITLYRYAPYNTTNKVIRMISVIPNARYQLTV